MNILSGEELLISNSLGFFAVVESTCERKFSCYSIIFLLWVLFFLQWQRSKKNQRKILTVLQVSRVLAFLQNIGISFFIKYSVIHFSKQNGRFFFLSIGSYQNRYMRSVAHQIIHGEMCRVTLIRQVNVKVISQLHQAWNRGYQLPGRDR